MSTPPPETTGITWRSVAADDIPDVVSLAAAVDQAEGLEFAGGPEFWAWWIRQHDPAADILAAVADDGAVLGLTGSYGTDSEHGARAILWFESHPDRPDLEPLLLAWATDRGREQVTAAGHHEKMIRVSVEEHRIRRRSLLEAEGFTAARSFVDMERSLTKALPARRQAPDGITVVPWTPELDESAREASNAAFKDHWGSLPMDAKAWASMVLDDDTARRDLSFVAKAGNRVVGVCLAEVDSEDDEAKQWISRVGTRPEWQRQGIASLLLTESLLAAAGAGLQVSALSVDEESRFDATAVYASLGYRVTTRSVTYVLEDRS